MHGAFSVTVSAGVRFPTRLVMSGQGGPLGNAQVLRVWTFSFFAGFLWSCYRIRNKMAIERQFPKPSDVMYSGLLYLQKWKTLLKEKDLKLVEEAMCKLMTTLKNLEPASYVSDIVEI